MTLNLNVPPAWCPTAIATAEGWKDPATGEIYYCCAGLDTLAGTADIIKAEFLVAPARGGDIKVRLTFNESIVVPAGGSSLVIHSASDGDTTIYAAGQTGNKIVFDKQADLTTQATFPDAGGVITIAAQTISGSLVDSLGAKAAQGVLSFTANPLNGETVTIDGVAYTFQTTLTNSAGNVKIGATLTATIANLVAAIKADEAGSGTAYAAATTVHTTVTAVARAGSMTCIAKTVGTAGNSIGTTETSTKASWGATTLTGGVAKPATSKTLSSAVGSGAGTKTIAAAAIVSAAFGAASYVATDALTATVTFDHAVDVSVGASLVVHSTQVGGDYTLYAAAQTNVTAVVFDKGTALGAGSVTVSVGAGVLNVQAQTLGGTIKDHSSLTASTKTLSAAKATAAGTRTIAA